MAIDGVRYSPADMLAKLNELGGANGIGRLDIVESRFVGMKSRRRVRNSGGTILLAVRRALETVCLDRGEMPFSTSSTLLYSTLLLLYSNFYCGTRIPSGGGGNDHGSSQHAAYARAYTPTSRSGH